MESPKFGPRVQLFESFSSLNALTLGPNLGDSITKVWPEIERLSHIFAVTPSNSSSLWIRCGWCWKPPHFVLRVSSLCQLWPLHFPHSVSVSVLWSGGLCDSSGFLRPRQLRRCPSLVDNFTRCQSFEWRTFDGHKVWHQSHATCPSLLQWMGFSLVWKGIGFYFPFCREIWCLTSRWRQSPKVEDLLRHRRVFAKLCLDCWHFLKKYFQTLHSLDSSVSAPFDFSTVLWNELSRERLSLPLPRTLRKLKKGRMIPSRDLIISNWGQIRVTSEMKTSQIVSSSF